MICKGCNLKGCQRKSNPPAGCLLAAGPSEGGYWVNVRRMECQERILRAGALEGGD